MDAAGLRQNAEDIHGTIQKNDKKREKTKRSGARRHAENVKAGIADQKEEQSPRRLRHPD